MKKFIIVGVAIAIAVSVLMVLRGVSKHEEYEEYKKTPEYSLQQLRQAVKNHDTASFEKYVDASGVVDDCVGPLLEADKFKGRSDNELVALGEFICRKLRYPSKSQLVAATRYTLTDYVKTGEYKAKGDEAEDLEPGVMLAEIWDEITGGAVAIEETHQIKPEGEQVRATLSVRFDKYKTTLPLDLLMEKRDDYWRVTGLGDFAEFLRQLVGLRNKAVLEAMNQTLILEGVEKSTTDGIWGIGRKVIFETRVRNQGTKEIERYALKVICITKDGEELDSFVVTNSEKILPGTEGKGFWYRDVNVFTGKGKMLYETEQSDMNITTSVESIGFADESTLEIWGGPEEMG